MACLGEVRLFLTKSVAISKGNRCDGVNAAGRALNRRPGARSEPGTHTPRTRFGEDSEWEPRVALLPVVMGPGLALRAPRDDSCMCCAAVGLPPIPARPRIALAVLLRRAAGHAGAGFAGGWRGELELLQEDRPG